VAEVKKLFEREAAHGLTTSWEVGWSSVSVAGSVAWMAMRGVMHIGAAGQESHVPLRITAVLEQREGTWLVVQGHTSMPATE
jgi:ketosteroid isomerase-like protein